MSLTDTKIRKLTPPLPPSNYPIHTVCICTLNLVVHVSGILLAQNINPAQQCAAEKM